MRKSLLIFVVSAFATGILFVVSVSFLFSPAYAKYVMRVNVGNVEISVESHTKSLLPDGKQLNRYLTGSFITSVIFDSYLNYPEMKKFLGINIGEYSEGASEEDEINLYYRGNTVYILSEKTIVAGSCREMFKNLYALGKIEFNNFDTSNTLSMRDMFYGCISLRKVVMNFNTAKVQDMSGMFRQCRALTLIDVTSFDTSSVVDMRSMFRDCRSLVTVYASDKFTVQKVENGDNMFKGCYNLIGGNGTRYGANVSHLYARIDKKGVPGYFTDKKNS